MYDIIKSIYINNKCGIKLKRTDFFTQGRGVRQGCSLRPTLFNIYINELVVLLEQSAAPGLTLNNTEVTFLLCADELVLLSPTAQGLQHRVYSTGATAQGLQHRGYSSIWTCWRNTVKTGPWQ